MDLETALLARLERDQLRMPPYPAIAMKLRELASKERVNTKEIASTIAADAALVAAVLRSANAATYSTGQHVVALEAAINRLGIDHVVRIAIAQSVGGAFSEKGALRALRRDVWRRSLLAGKIAVELATRRRVNKDEAYVAGLLHDFGAVTVLVGLEDLKVELPVLSAANWRLFVDRLQTRFGAVFAERWHLPPSIADAIQHCHQPTTYQGPNLPVVQVVGAAVAIIDRLDRSPVDGLSSLNQIKALRPEEVEHIGSFIPQIAQLMDAFEPPAEAPATSAAASAVDNTTANGEWPIDLSAMHKQDELRAVALAPNSIVLVSKIAMTQNWLVPLVIHSDPTVDTLMNITNCEPQPNKTFRITAQPFALGGAAKEAWLALLERSRPQ